MSTLKEMTQEERAKRHANEALINRVVQLIAYIEFQNYRFVVDEGHGGVYLKAIYEDADIYTGNLEDQHTRRWLLTPQMTDSEIVQTAFKCCLTSYEHRCREAFMYRGARIFSPHFDVEDLVRICKGGRDNAGDRK